MIENTLNRQLAGIARRVYLIRFWKRLALYWLVAAIAFGAIVVARFGAGWVPDFETVCVSILVTFVASLTVAFARTPNVGLLEAARLIEREFPELKQSLLAAIEQAPQSNGGWGALQQQLFRQIESHGHSNTWARAVPLRRLFGAYGLSIASFLLFACAVLGATYPNQTAKAVTENAPTEPTEEVVEEEPAIDYGLTVEPGDVEVERGTGLLVEARFDKTLPGEVALVFRGEDGREFQSPMSKSFDDPLFAARVPQVETAGEYHIAFDGEVSESFGVTVFDYPQIERTDIAVTFPEYTELPDTTIEDAQHVSVVEGSVVTLKFFANKPIVRVELQPVDSPASPERIIQRVDAQPNFDVSVQPTSAQRYIVKLSDEAGRGNKFPPEISINVVPNRPPNIKLVFPAKDLRVSPLEEVELEATVQDDFGVKDFGVKFAIAGEDERTVVLGDAVAAKEKHKMDHLLSLETLDAVPDQLVSYYFFADDFGPDGKLRRTFSDMYFAEVRHFEEIFREGQQPPAGQKKQQKQQQQGNQKQQQIEKLGELQKQIINATWNMIRRETSAEVSPSFAKDAQLLVDSQKSALEQAEELAKKIEDAKSKAFVAKVIQEMTLSSTTLELAVAESSAEPLRPALSHEQAAYQALLKLRAREHKVTQQQQQGGKPGQQKQANSRSQKQLNQLELNNKQNRYESEKQASAAKQQQSAAQREQLQVLNRLRDLARRQNAIVEKLKELESELSLAKTEEEKEEIRRRLKRLRDEQQQMLRDVDELKNRMEKPEAQEQLADSKKQLDETRKNVLQASDALKKGQVSQALNAGTRAQRELEDLKNDVRKKTANAFEDEVRDLRDRARELTDRQQKLADALDKNRKQRSLRYAKERKQIEEGLKNQKGDVDGMLEDMKRLVQKAESTEPLLSKQLYDSIRKARADNPQEALDISSRLVNRGLLREAQTAEAEARRGIDNLQSGVEKAAQGVIGDQAEALRRARDEIENLKEQLKGEVAKADPSALPKETPKGQSQTGKPQNGQPNQEDGKQGTNTSSRNPTKADANAQSPNQEPSQNPKSQQQTGAQDPKPNTANNGQPKEQQSPNGKPGQQQPKGQPNQQSQAKQPGQNQPGQPNSKPGQPGEKPGQQPNAKPGSQQQPNSKGQPGQKPNGQPGQQPNSQSQSKSQSQSDGKPGQRSQSQSNSQSQSKSPSQSQSQSKSQSQSNSQSQSSSNSKSQSSSRSQSQPSLLSRGGLNSGPGAGPDERQAPAPLTGEGFREWSDRLRDVEEMLDDPKLRAEVAKVRDRARTMRAEFKRHSREPNWDLVRTSILEPMIELESQIANELARQQEGNLVPIDRDPVPDRFSELVKKYYEGLGKGRRAER